MTYPANGAKVFAENKKEANYMDSCDSRSRSTYNDGTDLDYISSVCRCVLFHIYSKPFSIVISEFTTY